MGNFVLNKVNYFKMYKKLLKPNTFWTVLDQGEHFEV